MVWHAEIPVLRTAPVPMMILAGLVRQNNIKVVITGEGALDDQSLMGKGVGELGARCRQAGTRCIALTGACGVTELERSPFEVIRALTPEFATTSEALSQPARSLRCLAEQVATNWATGPQ